MRSKATATTPQRPIKRKVEPLLTCKWSQYDPFNKYTPLSNGQHTPTGCVATATAQVMFYNKWPKNRHKIYRHQQVMMLRRALLIGGMK